MTLDEQQKLREDLSDRRWGVASALGLCVMLGSRIWNIASYSPWLDEVFSLDLARGPWTALFQKAAADGVHPPLFYFLLKLWTNLGGESIAWIRTLPLVFALVAVVPLYMLMRSLKQSRWVFTLTLWIAALNPFLIYYSQEVRMYSLLGLLSLLSLAQFARLVGRDRTAPWYALTIVNVLLVYTHYFGWLTIGAETIAVLLIARDRIAPFFKQLSYTAIAFLPWAAAVVTSRSTAGFGQNLSWITDPQLSDIPWLLAEFTASVPVPHLSVVGLLIFFAPAVVWLVSLANPRRRQAALSSAALLVSAAAVPMIIAFSANVVLGSSIWVDRYMIAAVVPLMLIAVIGVFSLSARPVRIFFIVAMLLWSIAGSYMTLTGPPSRVDWGGVAALISSDPAGSPVYVTEPWTRAPVEYALEQKGDEVHVLRLTSDPGTIVDPAFWLVYRTSTLKGTEPAQHLSSAGCFSDQKKVDRIAGDSVVVVRFDCGLDRSSGN